MTGVLSLGGVVRVLKGSCISFGIRDFQRADGDRHFACDMSILQGKVYVIYLNLISLNFGKGV